MYLKKLFNETAIYGISSIIGRLLNYLLIPYYTRIFSPSEYGIVTDLYSIAAIFIVILTYGMETTLFRFINKNPDNENKVLNTSFTTLLLSSCSFIVIAYLLKDFLSMITGYQNNKSYIIYFIFILGIDSFLSIPFAYLRQREKSIKFALLKIINIFSNIFFNIIFLVVLPKFNYINIDVKYIFISNLISTIITFLLLFPLLKNFKLRIDFSILKQMIKYSIPILIAGLAGIINESMDKQFLKYLLPKNIALKEIGIYGACYKISIFLSLFIQAFRMGAEPFFFKKAEDNDAKNIYSNTMLYFAFMISFIYLLINTNINIVKYFIGESYREGLKIVPIILIANLFLGLYTNISIWYKIIDKTIFGVLFSFIGVLFTISINIIFIPKYGYVASAWATFFAYFSMTIISYFFGQKYYKINYKLGSILLYILLSVLFSFMFIILGKNYYFGLLLNILLLTLFVYKEKLWKQILTT